MCNSATPWTVARQAHLSMGCSSREYWSGLPSPPPGNLPESRIKPASSVFPALQVNSLPQAPGEAPRFSVRLFPPTPTTT